MSDDIRSRILARRAKFVAAAVASAGILGCSEVAPQVCLEPLFDGSADTSDDANDAGTDTRPQACLAPEPPDTSTADSADDAADTAIEDTGPMPCLVPPLDGGD